jgi:putative Holliday junction resolvase
VRAIGLDVGSKTIGLAVSDADGSIATARSVLARGGHAQDAKAVVELAVAEEASRIVVGLPLELDGSEGRRARAVRRFVEVLQPALAEALPEATIALWDERFSTSAAERTLLEADLSRAKRKQKIDAVAAQFILQGWLDAQPASNEDSSRDDG